MFCWLNTCSKHTEIRGRLFSLLRVSLISIDIINPSLGVLIWWTVLRSPPEQKTWFSFSDPCNITPTPSVQDSTKYFLNRILHLWTLSYFTDPIHLQLLKIPPSLILQVRYLQVRPKNVVNSYLWKLYRVDNFFIRACMKFKNTGCFIWFFFCSHHIVIYLLNYCAFQCILKMKNLFFISFKVYIKPKAHKTHFIATRGCYLSQLWYFKQVIWSQDIYYYQNIDKISLRFMIYIFANMILFLDIVICLIIGWSSALPLFIALHRHVGVSLPLKIF